MKINDIIKPLELQVITGQRLLDREIIGGCVGDLLSVVMGQAKKDSVWVTVQSHINVIAVASLVEVSCVIVSEGFAIDDEAIHKAIEEDVVLLASKKTSYELCVALGKLNI